MGITTSQYDDSAHFTTKARSHEGRVGRGFREERNTAENKMKSVEKSQTKNSKKTTLQQQAQENLMAYLEIVGENADDLPLTWRDGREAGRAVSSLTAKKIAAKAHAFVPCDVRVIAGTSTRYGNTIKNLLNREVCARSKRDLPFECFEIYIKHSFLLLTQFLHASRISI